MTTIDMISQTSSWLDERTHFNADDALGRTMRAVTLALATAAGDGVAILFETVFFNLFS